VLGGDHLGPNPWQHRRAADAMREAAAMVAAYVEAGFEKIHLDASMACADDPARLDDRTIAARAAQLCRAAESAASRAGLAPVYVIGTEVPTPGGEVSADGDGAAIARIAVTRSDSIGATLDAHRSAFAAAGLDDAWTRVVAVVAQPGVDFDDRHVLDYDSAKAAALGASILRVPRLVFEAHSTDYQTEHALAALVRDHFAVLKVGPALTFALREALFALSFIEDALIGDVALRSRLRDVVDAAMRAQPEHWAPYYRGDEAEQRLARQFGYSDRIRYYWLQPAVAAAVEQLFDNLARQPVPETLVAQWLPDVYAACRAGVLAKAPRAWVRHRIRDVIAHYARACGCSGRCDRLRTKRSTTDTATRNNTQHQRNTHHRRQFEQSQETCHATKDARCRRTLLRRSRARDGCVRRVGRHADDRDAEQPGHDRVEEAVAGVREGEPGHQAELGDPRGERAAPARDHRHHDRQRPVRRDGDRHLRDAAVGQARLARADDRAARRLRPQRHREDRARQPVVQRPAVRAAVLRRKLDDVLPQGPVRGEGLKMPDQPTYDQVAEFADKLTDKSKGIYGICLRGKAGWGENMAYVSTVVNTFGGRWFDENWNAQLTSPEWKKAIGFYVNLLKKDGPPGASSNGFNENLTLTASGKCAMWIDATVAAGMLYNKQQSQVADKIGFAAAPVAVTPKGSHWLWAWALAVPKTSKQQDAARKFIAWATSKQYIEMVGKDEGWASVPPGTRTSTYQRAEYKAAAPFSEFVLKAIETADPNDPSLKKVPYTGVQYVGILNSSRSARWSGRRSPVRSPGRCRSIRRSRPARRRPTARCARPATGSNAGRSRRAVARRRVRRGPAQRKRGQAASARASTGGIDHASSTSSPEPRAVGRRRGDAARCARARRRAAVSPSVAVLLLWMSIPLAMTIWYSFSRYNLLNPDVKGFAGFDNYRFLATDPSFLPAIWHTLVLIGAVLAITVVGGVLMAVLFDRKFYGQGIARLLRSRRSS
jgi:D-tagatose-1,6-bisphosphate aldolase subunit GatZ/KbaZ